MVIRVDCPFQILIRLGVNIHVVDLVNTGDDGGEDSGEHCFNSGPKRKLNYTSVLTFVLELCFYLLVSLDIFDFIKIFFYLTLSQVPNKADNRVSSCVQRDDSGSSF